jgi:hypothetical protein
MPDPKHIWRNQKTEDVVTIEDVRARADKLQRRVGNRNMREYAAGILVIAVFGWYAWTLHGWMIKAGSALCIAAAVFVMWQLHRRASASLPGDQSATKFAEYYRGELARQRDALKSVWSWYLLPFVPGVALLLLGRYVQSHAPMRSLAWDHEVIILVGVIVALVFVAVGLLNSLGAARLQRQIDELDK